MMQIIEKMKLNLSVKSKKVSQKTKMFYIQYACLPQRHSSKS